MTTPVYTASEARTRETFLALMWALSYPGRAYALPDLGEPFALIAETLLDLETSGYSPDEMLQAALRQTGARLLPPETAAYHFYPTVSDAELTSIRAANVGTPLDPETGATLIIGCVLGSGAALTLRGPGVRGAATVQVSGVPSRLWALRESACRFPLGWDIYLIDGRQVVGLPRSLHVEIAEGEG
jgi:alpha-D-ribose 1-methylphosphonate 5-triphosphate synthase subunit PhnH